MPAVFGPSEGPLCLLHLPSGRSRFFATRDEAAPALRALKVGRLRGDPIEPHLELFAAARGGFAEWSLTNVYGDTLGWTDLPARRPRPWRATPDWEVGVRRRSAVSGTGQRRAYSNYLRYPKTLRLLRDAVARDGDEVAVPPTRQHRSTIRTNRDDIARGTQRSWKHHRRTRWK